MKFVVCRDDVVIADWEKPILFSDVSLVAKQIFIKYQSQDIYMKANGDKSRWVKCSFIFDVHKSGMHPKSVRFDNIVVDKLPADMQMKLLMGAL